MTNVIGTINLGLGLERQYLRANWWVDFADYWLLFSMLIKIFLILWRGILFELTISSRNA